MYTFNSANNDVDFNIPIFKSLPAILRSDDNSDIVSNVELKKISIQDIYQLEPFNPSEETKLHIAVLESGDTSRRSPMHYCTTKIFILLIIIIIILYILFYWK